jgi:hypothetical protein
MSLFTDLITPSSLSETRDLVLGYARDAKLKVTSWQVGDVGQQMIEIISTATFMFAGTAVPAIVRKFASLNTATDPGDVDPYDDDNVTRDQEYGALSYIGENSFGTIRRDRTFGTGAVQFANVGTQARTIRPGGLVFTWTQNTPPSPAPTYVNIEDDSVYTNPDGSVTLLPGTITTLPVRCQVIGSLGSAPALSLSLTTSMVGCSATNDSPIVGQDREDADLYRARCKLAMARVSLNGAEDAYLYYANTFPDGEPLTNVNGQKVGINRVQATQASSTGRVVVYFANSSGPASAIDIEAANGNISNNAIITPDAITYSGVQAVSLPIRIGGTARVKRRAGLSVDDVKVGIVQAIARYGKTVPIGGVERDTQGNGRIYTRDIEDAAKLGYSGLYAMAVTTPNASYVSVPVGNVAVLQSYVDDWTVVIA